MTSLQRGPHVKTQSRCFHLDLSGRVDVLHATYVGRAFQPHWHDEHAIGLVTDGVEKFQYCGSTHYASRGEVVLLNAGEIHTGDSGDRRGFAFQMLYVPESSFREVVDSTRLAPQELRFSAAILQNVGVRERLRSAHLSIASKSSSLQAESLLLEALASVLQYATSLPTPKRIPLGCATVSRAREYLQANLVDEVSLAELAHVAELSRHHLLRLFRRQYGLPPHAYQLQERILRSKEMLKTMRIADIAASLGFADQSHFHRVFRSFVGTTPGCYAEQFRSRHASGDYLS